MAISALSSGISGMHSAAGRFEASASRVARAGTGLGDTDLTTEMVNVLMAKHEFEANAKVVKAVSDVQKSALDILV